ncbi:MAG TPA: energy-coupling factor ABC transporter permease [Acidimicrobiia bacterium]|jgi:cobalt/nickel transport system permease protein|nr:energy-coupling factor ABC transporter permease [Acidimicrobiia bacterium]
MHIPDGFINVATAAGAGVVAASGLGASLRRTGRDLSERQIPFAGLTAAFIFAVQMLNFPVGAGTSGHLLGGSLAAILLGPWLGVLAVAVVVFVQALMFADGGIVALGLNVLNMALVTALVGWGVFRSLVKLLPRRSTAVMIASMVAGALSVVASALAFVLQYAIGGEGAAPLQTVFPAMVGVHSLIGIGEGVITALAVGAVLAVRPDLIKGLSDLKLPRLATTPSRRSIVAFVAAGLVVALALVFLVAPIASGDPDGLERVAIDNGFIESAKEHPLEGPLADYGVSGIENEETGTVLAGAIGVGATFVAGLIVTTILRRRRSA